MVIEQNFLKSPGPLVMREKSPVQVFESVLKYFFTNTELHLYKGVCSLCLPRTLQDKSSAVLPDLQPGHRIGCRSLPLELGRPMRFF